MNQLHIFITTIVMVVLLSLAMTWAEHYGRQQAYAEVKQYLLELNSTMIR